MDAQFNRNTLQVFYICQYNEYKGLQDAKKPHPLAKFQY